MNVETPVVVYADGIPSSQIELTSSNGTIKVYGSGFVMRPESVGDVKITAFYGRTEIGNYTFFAKKLPRPKPVLGNWEGTHISKSQLLSIPVLSAEMPPYTNQSTAEILSFDLAVYRKGVEIVLKSGSNQFTPEQKDFMKNLTPNDKIYIENIKAKTSDGFTHELEIIKIILK